MTQQQLADALGVSQKTIDSWEHDRHYPKSAIGALEDVLDTSLTGPEVAQRSARPVPAELRRMIAAQLDDPEDQERVIGLLEGTLEWPDPPEHDEGEGQRAG